MTEVQSERHADVLPRQTRAAEVYTQMDSTGSLGN